MVDDVASTGSLRGGWRGEHIYPMWWMAWRAQANLVIDNRRALVIGTLYGEHLYTT